MILDALVRHYDQLVEDPDSDVVPFPFRKQRIALCVEIEPDGALFAIRDVRYSEDNRILPLRLELPYLKTRTSGDWPNFLWDNTGYVLGTDAKTNLQKVLKRHKLFVDFHHEMAKKVSDNGLDAVCRFLDQWMPSRIAEFPISEDLLGEQMAFQIRNQTHYIHDNETLRRLWRNHYEAVIETVPSISLLNNESTEVCLTHPAIQGVQGTNTTGASIVSFNLKAFESHGLRSNANAPLTPKQAFKYTTALNALLGDEKHRVRLGDTTCIFWTEKPSDAPDALAQTLGAYSASNEPSAAEKQSDTQSALHDFLDRYRKGKDPGTSVADLKEADVPFYALGLSPNAARISIRFWLQCTVAQLAQRLDRHVTATEMVGSRDNNPSPTIRQLLRETGREAKDIPPQLAGDMTRAVLMDTPYPRTFAVAILRRIVADRIINHPRAAGLKAWLTRNHPRNHQKEIPMALDPDRTDPSYLLGRLFATYEKIQNDSSGGKLNRTVRDSYLSAASASPASVFPRLYRLSQHHLGKLRRDKPGLAVVRERLIGEICNHLDNFPTRLSLENQGLFAIGYYHQNQDFYKPRVNDDALMETTTNA